MAIFQKTIEVRWTDIDANQHVTHTAYASFATHARVAWLTEVGCSMSRLLELGFGAVLLKEITEYQREIVLGEEVIVELHFAGSTADQSRWKFIHYIYKANQKLAAVNTVYGAWIDSRLRKITPPPPELLNLLSGLTKAEDFENLV